MAQTNVGTRIETEKAEDRPQLCPAPSDESIAYQQQITGLPPGLEVRLNGVRFDG